MAAGTLVANALLFSVADHDTGISEPASHALSRFLRLVTKSGNEELENIGTTERGQLSTALILTSL